MKDRSPKADEILDAAERMARTGGYNGFSFREIAKAVGIKAASVHYHFPGKDDLGAAVARRYTDRFLDALGAPDDPAAPEELLAAYVALYRNALAGEGLMCLCGIFGAEIAALPAPVANEARTFFERNVDWLDRLFARAHPGTDPARCRAAALRTVATLEGAMILARSLDDIAAFDGAAAGITIAL